MSPEQALKSLLSDQTLYSKVGLCFALYILTMIGISTLVIPPIYIGFTYIITAIFLYVCLSQYSFGIGLKHAILNFGFEAKNNPKQHVFRLHIKTTAFVVVVVSVTVMVALYTSHNENSQATTSSIERTSELSELIGYTLAFFLVIFNYIAAVIAMGFCLKSALNTEEADYNRENTLRGYYITPIKMHKHGKLLLLIGSIASFTSIIIAEGNAPIALFMNAIGITIMAIYMLAITISLIGKGRHKTAKRDKETNLSLAHDN